MLIPATLLVAWASSWFLTGLIWFVQVVHYPLFGRVGPEAFGAYHAAHTRLTTWVVAGPMLVELAAAGLLAFRPAPGVPAWLSWMGLALVVGVWVSTGAVQVPLHRRLAHGYDAAAVAALVEGNLVRACLWTAHAAATTWQIVAWAGSIRGVERL